MSAPANGPDESTKTTPNGPDLPVQSTIQSIAGVPLGPGGSNSPEVMRKVTDKLKELLGEDAATSFANSYNEKGEMLNEEGLPIIEITEPVSRPPQKQIPDEPSSLDEEIIPLSQLSPQERARRKRERDRVLDILEEEERLEQLKESEETDVRKSQLLERSKDLEHQRKMKELQKKMGRVLVGTPPSTSAQLPAQNSTRSSAPASTTKDPVAPSDTKKVSFETEADKDADNDDGVLNSGSVSLARLRSLTRPNLMSKSPQLPMKDQVVERLANGRGQLPIDHSVEADSDDESVQSTTTDSDVPLPEASITSSDEDEEDPDDNSANLEDEEYDLDTMKHNREVALEYYTKRTTVGAAAREAMTQAMENGEDDVDPEYPILPDQVKPPLSKFRARQIANNFAESSSLGTVLPASSVNTMQKAVRMGNLDDRNRLVGGESSDEEEGALAEVLELVKEGKVTNVGPDWSAYSSTQPDATPVVNPQPQTRAAQPQGTTAMPSAIVESPSFRPPARLPTRPDKPPVVMSSRVLERTKPSSAQLEEPKAKKVSRFMRDRES